MISGGGRSGAGGAEFFTGLALAPQIPTVITSIIVPLKKKGLV